jgi:hypothetical protein
LHDIERQPPAFDSNGTYDGSLSVAYIAPLGRATRARSGATARCRAGEPSWNSSTHVLTINGTIFFDGDISVDDKGLLINYQGRGTIMTSGQWKQSDIICAGGNGSNNCFTSASAMATWSPSQNLLTVVAGGKTTAGHDDVLLTYDNSAFQGIFYAVHRCKESGSMQFSGPQVCGVFMPDSTPPRYYTWPKLGNSLPVMGSGGGTTLSLGQELG